MEGQENIQELLTKQLVLCQYMCALAILRKGKWVNLYGWSPRRLLRTWHMKLKNGDEPLQLGIKIMAPLELSMHVYVTPCNNGM